MSQRRSRRDDRLDVAWSHTGTHLPRGSGEACILAPAAAASATGTLALNRVGSWIWERLDGTASGTTLVAALMAEFDVERSRAERDYLALIEELAELGAIGR